ncbi:Uma2 family endonuclease [Paucibacter sp. B51]|uniref:Uma2 family endonuclease n=1 Tax=Paucibacter sp. B51 TaxID=2993315 RepID=UPI0022EBCDA2|nr:Uma2 family endonuclease [Paucibacter sp. B51]
MSMLLQKMTLAEFLAWEASQPARFEFCRGHVLRLGDVPARQNRVAMNLASRIDKHLDGSACQVFAIGMKVQADESILYPDVLVTCGKTAAGDEQLVHDPKLVIEIRSPNKRGDRHDRFNAYRTLVSLQEYALIDAVDRRVEVFTMSETGACSYADQTRDGVMTLRSIDLSMPLEAVFKGVEAAEGNATL